MKKIIFLTIAAALVMSCGNNSSEKKQSEVQAEVQSTKANSELKVYSVSDIIENGAELQGKEVNIQGFITHTCKHSGRRCFVVGKDDSDLSIRVEAGGKIGGFNRELVGAEVLITGVVMEQRLSKEYLKQYEEQLNEQIKKEDGNIESCGSELANLEAIKEKLKAEGKDYYSTYFLNGVDYKEIKTTKEN